MADAHWWIPRRRGPSASHRAPPRARVGGSGSARRGPVLTGWKPALENAPTGAEPMNGTSARSVSPLTVLVLDGALPLAPASPPPDQRARVLRAAGPLEAAVEIARHHPHVLVLGGPVAWHRVFVRSLPQSRRPLTVSVGAPVGWSADVAVPKDAGMNQILWLLRRSPSSARAGRLEAQGPAFTPTGGWFEASQERGQTSPAK